jgi:enterochelin esterase-like enzyme
MKNLFSLLVVMLLTAIIVSCKSAKVVSKTESKYYTDSIYSKSLSEYRKHNVYLPQNFNKQIKHSIIYATDGSSISADDAIKKTLDSLIENKIIKPIILIESFSNQKVADSSGTFGDGRKLYLQYRNFEYVNDNAAETENQLLAARFDNHKSYFKDELIASVENKFNQKLNKKDRYFYGSSNGAGFGMSLLNTHPNTIGTYLCFSTFGGNAQTNNWEKGVDYPDLYLKYGKYEPPFLKDDADFLTSKYTELNQFIEVEEFEGGHDRKKWKESFNATIIKLFALK